MATFTLTVTGTASTVYSGAAPYVSVENTGGTDVFLSTGARLRPGQALARLEVSGVLRADTGGGGNGQLRIVELTADFAGGGFKPPTVTSESLLTAKPDGTVGTVLPGTYARVPDRTKTAVVYVATDGNDANDGASWGTAKATLPGAIAVMPAGGGLIELGLGTFTLTTSVTIPVGVNVAGRHKYATTLRYSADLGAGVVGITLAGNQQTNPAGLRDLRILGPGFGQARVLGTSPANMDGVRTAERSLMQNVVINGFRANIVIKDNHESFIGVKSENAYFNVYFGPGATSFGNQSFIDCDLTGAAYASVGVAVSNTVSFATFSGTHTGFGPYCFVKEAGTATRPFIDSSTFINTSFEAVGNGAILDLSTGGNGLPGTQIINPGFSWADDMKITSVARTYAVSCPNGSSNNLFIVAGAAPFTAGATAAFNLPGEIQMTYQGTPVASMFAPNTANGARIEADTYSATVFTAAAAIGLGEYLERKTVNTVQRYGVEGGRGPVGVAMNAAASGAAVVVAFEGEVNALCRSVSTSGVALVPDETALYILRPVSSQGGNGYPYASATAVANQHPIVAYSTTNGGHTDGAYLKVRLTVNNDRTYVRPGSVSALPTAAARYRGQMLVVEGNGTTTADVLWICMRSATGTYAWVQVSTG